MALGDVDGDGDLDMVFGNLVQQNRLYLNTGAGFYTDATAARMPAAVDNTNAVALGDVDGDGDLDMVVGNYAEQNRLYLNDGTGTFTDMPPRRACRSTATRPKPWRWTTWTATATSTSSSGTDVRTGSTGTTAPAPSPMSTAGRMPLDMDDNTSAVALGDVDGDGDLDMVFGKLRAPQNQLYLNDGYGFYTDVTAARMPADPRRHPCRGAGRRGRRRRPRHRLRELRPSQQNRLYLNDGTGPYTDATAAHMPTGDGTYVPWRWATWTATATSTWSSGNLGGAVRDRRGTEPALSERRHRPLHRCHRARMPAVDTDSTHAVALGDVDGDGDLDIVTANLGRLLGNVGERTGST